jgi:hypothetical protein
MPTANFMTKESRSTAAFPNVPTPTMQKAIASCTAALFTTDERQYRVTYDLFGSWLEQFGVASDETEEEWTPWPSRQYY